MKYAYIAREADMKQEFDANGFACCELLPGSYDGGIRNYKCWLKAGCQVSPELRAKDTVLLMFGKGKGYITSASQMHFITEPSFYVPAFAQEAYTVHALEDMEFVMSVIEMNEWDWQKYNECHVRLPFFMKYTDGTVYDQDCKGPHTTSWLILGREQIGRIMLGVVRAVGEGTTEKGHSTVAQWNYCLGDADFELTVADAPAEAHKAGEWSYVPAGLDHSLVAKPGKEVFYVWFEHFTREKDFSLTLAAGQTVQDALNH